MQVWCDWQLTLCDPHLSALEVRFHDDALYKSMFTFTFTIAIDVWNELPIVLCHLLKVLSCLQILIGCLNYVVCTLCSLRGWSE